MLRPAPPAPVATLATDLAGESVDEPLRPVDTEAESNLMRLLSETHGSPR